MSSTITVHCVMMVAVVAELLSKEFVEFKENKYLIRATMQDSTTAAAAAETGSDAGEERLLEPLVVKISDIPSGLSEQIVYMILENKRYGGGALRHMEFNESERSAIVEYEEHAGKSVDYAFVVFFGCTLFAYGPADATAFQNHIISCLIKSRLVLPFRCRLTQVALVKRLLNECSIRSCSSCLLSLCLKSYSVCSQAFFVLYFLNAAVDTFGIC